MLTVSQPPNACIGPFSFPRFHGSLVFCCSHRVTTSLRKHSAFTANNESQTIHISSTIKSFPPLPPANKPDSSRANPPPPNPPRCFFFFFLHTHHIMTHIIRPRLLALLCWAEIAAPPVAAEHRWEPRTVSRRLFRTHGAQHICYALRSIFCTNLFVTIH